MSEYNDRQSLFTRHYEAAREIQFNQSYNNGTGYFDSLVWADLGLADGEVVRMHTGPENRRRILIVGSPFGNIVVFDRYTDCAKRNDDNAVFVRQFSEEVGILFGRVYDGNLKLIAMQHILGFGPQPGENRNLGHELGKVFNATRRR